ncbi:hypothetical protein SSU05_0460 [Streptococcus suis 05ZYH33]|nr:hypothetical protein SSU05_0460 [Streptococcus suis 05ZYH33]
MVSLINIHISVQRSFNDEFWKIYKNHNQYRDDYIKVRLQERITLVEKADRDELIFTIFGRENWENYNLSESIFVFIENIDSDEGKQFFRVL